ncbi:hypothetical protein Purlil1_13276 [Purpureocillium lilacinum]|uniref:Protein kinase domain-containing protein n=1 Tax=Purpureocillium lilacinum TaxID=33203 RepID=A0ABR0BEH4_PURLI|nr:hypothetical protein Purlil1_13276 [Purpureocillium lilacinum]
MPTTGSRRDVTIGPESSDEEPNPRAPGTPTPAQPNTRQGARRSEGLAMRPGGGGAGNSGQRRPFCTQKCLLGLLRGHVMTTAAPTLSPLPREEGIVGAVPSVTHRPCRMAAPAPCAAQGDTAPLCTAASRVLNRAAKGTIKAFIPDLELEAAVYRRLEDTQGIHVPVFLGAVDLQSLDKTYYYDHRVYMPTMEEQVKRGLHALHQHGVIHKDVRAPNILFCEETGGAMMIDFERAELLERPRRPLVKMASNKRLLSDVPGERKRCKWRQGTTPFCEDLLMARSLFFSST